MCNAAESPCLRLNYSESGVIRYPHYKIKRFLVFRFLNDVQWRERLPKFLKTLYRGKKRRRDTMW